MTTKPKYNPQAPIIGKKITKKEFEPYFTVRDVTEAEKRARQKAINASHEDQVRSMRESMERKTKR